MRNWWRRYRGRHRQPTVPNGGAARRDLDHERAMLATAQRLRVDMAVIGERLGREIERALGVHR